MENKSILMSIQPKWVEKILNGKKTIEVRKKFPKDYVGWVYIYCTKGKPNIQQYLSLAGVGVIAESIKPNYINGKVVARFWCDKVEEIMQAKLDTGVGYDYIYDTDTLLAQDFVKKCCLNNWDLLNYFGYKYGNGDVVGYAIHISKLEVFDEPRVLTMFRKPEFNKNIYDNNGNRLSLFERLRKYSITKAPQSWCYVEG